MDELEYKDVNFAKAEVDFTGSERLDKARRSYLVFLVVVLFLEFADVELQSASLSIVTAKINRPWVITLGFWLLFLYSFAVYFLAARKELALFTFKNSKSVTFFCGLSRKKFVDELREKSNVDYFQPGSGTVKEHDESRTVIKYETKGIPEDVLGKLNGFDPAERTFTYHHEPEDDAYFRKVVPLLRKR